MVVSSRNSLSSVPIIRGHGSEVAGTSVEHLVGTIDIDPPPASAIDTAVGFHGASANEAYSLPRDSDRFLLLANSCGFPLLLIFASLVGSLIFIVLSDA